MRYLLTSLFLFGLSITFGQSKYNRILNSIDDNKTNYSGIAQQIWSYAEMGYQETQSSALLQKTLEEAGFKITTGVADIPTAFTATYGSGGPVIAVLGEFDALPGLSQKAVPYKVSNDGKAGHACGHHLFGTASAAAAIAIKNYLKTIESSVVEFDFIKLDTDLKNGMFFDSTIPQGYGVGSSGALVAALYDRYALNKITVLENLTKPKILILKNIFSKMESFFHGKSSGLDPLNSYLSLPILIHSKNEIETTGIPSQSSNGKGAVFLLDSGMSSETAPMVDLFFKSMKNKNYNKIIKENFIKTTDDCVEDFLNGNFNSLFTNMKILSKVVLENFKPMIPKDFHQLWKKGIESDDYFLKLCGSGGGGYILGFSKDFQKAKESLSNYKLEVVYNF